MDKVLDHPAFGTTVLMRNGFDWQESAGNLGGSQELCGFLADFAIDALRRPFAATGDWPCPLGYRPSKRSAFSLCRPRCRVTEAMFMAPASRSRLMARLRSEAII